ncbi:MAG: hypothetical protein L3J08_06050 [Flavobacteriaceae bacterium]|nr:hypothetical protein [Flavobacteriaceae bacterium]
MNNKLIFAICTLIMCFGCFQDKGNLYKTSATIYLVNETSVVVKSDDRLGHIIQPGETVIHKESYENEYGERPTINTYQPFPSAYLFFYINVDESRCEAALRDIENYENIKEVSPLNFELTFRFTEERRAEEKDCNFSPQ